MIFTTINKAISKWFVKTETKTKTVNVCGYNITFPMEISVEAENDVLNIIKEAHEKWYFENKQNIPFDAMSWSYDYSLNHSTDSTKKFRRIAVCHNKYTQCYGFLIAYDVVGFYDNPRTERDCTHWQELRNISIQKLESK